MAGWFAARRWLALVAVLAPLVHAGCASTDKAPPLKGHAAVRTMIWDAPRQAGFWDPDPEPDGVRVWVYFYDTSDRCDPVEVDGMLTFGITPGDVRDVLNEKTKRRPPMVTWKFGPAEMKTHLQSTPVGWGYSFKLDWGPRVPPPGPATLVVNFMPAKAHGSGLLVGRKTIHVPGPLKQRTGRR